MLEGEGVQGRSLGNMGYESWKRSEDNFKAKKSEGKQVKPHPRSLRATCQQEYLEAELSCLQSKPRALEKDYARYWGGGFLETYCIANTMIDGVILGAVDVSRLLYFIPS